MGMEQDGKDDKVRREGELLNIFFLKIQQFKDIVLPKIIGI
jgi:hypothetical protein